MNIEENRLRTFANWPQNAVVPPERIAKAGFFAVNQDLVECFSCGLRISEWTYGDQAMTRHIRLNPQCPYVLDPSTSGNVPRISQNVEYQQPDLRDEATRLETFVNWPVPDIVSPEDLARAGFYSVHQRDKTKCAFCNGVVGSWEIGDNPDLEHKRHFPECSFVRETINPRLQPTNTNMEQSDSTKNPTNAFPSNLNLVSNENLQELGIYSHSAPKRPQFATYESRLSTYSLWPVDLIQTPEVLAQAGFYYEGRGDQVRCFHCDGGLRHWDPQDDPWTEHARWFPRCSFVRLIKGLEFINACAIEQNVGSNLEEVAYKQDTTPPQRKEVSDRELQTHMSTPQALAALEVGLHVGRVKQALKEKLERTGSTFATADALIEATLNLQREEEDSGGEPDSQTSRAVARIMGEILEEIGDGNLSTGAATQSAPVPKKEESASAAKTAGKKVLSLEEENRLLKEARLCKICMDNEVGIVFLPCGHLATCVNCAPNLRDCPVCRSSIKATVRTFLS